MYSYKQSKRESIYIFESTFYLLPTSTTNSKSENKKTLHVPDKMQIIISRAVNVVERLINTFEKLLNYLT